MTSRVCVVDITTTIRRPAVSDLTCLLNLLAREPAVLVSVSGAKGSVPRECGAWMAVGQRELIGTIGGGHLEWDALRQCRRCLEQLAEQDAISEWTQTVALGPSLGQCCGGVVSLRYELVGPGDREALAQRLMAQAQPLALFGGGHVGNALVRALQPLSFRVRWIDSRDEVFPDELAPEVETEHSDPVQGAVADLEPGSAVLIMSFSHAEDLDVVAACLERIRRAQDLPFVGLIGSRTKWASFCSRLRARGFSETELAHVTCPIGLPGITGKAPAVIAASVVAQLLMLNDHSSATAKDI